jgi:ADP-heptose:LPS heptosyltransferase
MQEREDGRYFVPRLFSYFARSVGKSRAFHLPGDIANASSLIFIDSGDVVDLLFAAPVINFFATHFPLIKTTFLVRSVDAELVKGLMRVNAIISYEPRQLKLYSADYLALARKLRKKKIDIAILFDRGYSPERHLLAFAIGAPIRIGFAHPLAFPFLNCEIRLSDGRYEGKKMPRILQSIGLKLEEGWDTVTLVPRDVQHARQLKHFWKPEKDLLMVGLDPSSSKTRHHVIPEIIAYLANNLASRRRAKFLIFANPWDEKLVGGLAAELKGDVIDLKPESPSETVALLSQCDLFLSGNTNLFHFAAALKVPTIGLFTKFDRTGWIPESAPHVRIFEGTRGEKLSLKDFFHIVEEVLATRSGAPAEHERA